MVGETVEARPLAHTGDARLALQLEALHGALQVVGGGGDEFSQRIGILDPHGGPLRGEGNDGMRRIADEHHARPVAPGAAVGHLEQRPGGPQHFLLAQHAQAWMRPAKRALDDLRRRRRPPACRVAAQLVVLDGQNDVEHRALAQRIDDQVLALCQEGGDVVLAVHEFGQFLPVHAVGQHGGAQRHLATRLRFLRAGHERAHGGSYAVGPDQHVAIDVARVAVTVDGDRHAVLAPGVGRHFGRQQHADTGFVADGGDHRLVHVAAVGAQVGRAPVLARIVADGQRDQEVALVQAPQIDRRDLVGRRAQQAENAELFKHVGGVRRQLDSGTAFLQMRRPFQHSDPEAAPCKRDSRRQAGDARSGNEDMAGVGVHHDR